MAVYAVMWTFAAAICSTDVAAAVFTSCDVVCGLTTRSLDVVKLQNAACMFIRIYRCSRSAQSPYDSLLSNLPRGNVHNLLYLAPAEPFEN